MRTCRHLDKASTCSYSTKASTSKWASTTTRRRGGRSVHVLLQKQKAKKNRNNKDKSYKSNGTHDNKISQQNHYYQAQDRRAVQAANGELQMQVEKLRHLVGERDAEVRDLAYKDLLPDQMLRAQHALQTLQDHLTEQQMRQLLGSDPPQAVLGVICQKSYYKRSSTRTIATAFR